MPPLPAYPHPCAPPWFARGGHAQTLLGHLLPSPEPPVSTQPGARRLEVPLDDGDRLVAHVLSGTSDLRVHLFHGLSGDADADYMRRAAAVFRARGHTVVAGNHRGCGAGRGLARRPYHSGSGTDLATVLDASRREAPRAKHVAIGYSLSGNALLLAAAQGRLAHLDGLIAVCPPVDLARTSRALNAGWARLYELRFTRRLRNAIREREGKVPRAIGPWASMRDLEEHYTAPRGGFRGADDYHERCSAFAHLAQVPIPAVVLATRDDPFAQADYAALELPEHVHLHLEDHGGHTGFLTARGRGCARWLEGALVHYVEALTARSAGVRFVAGS